MSENTVRNTLTSNKMLAALPVKEYQRLADKPEFFDLKIGETIYQPNENIEYIYFPNSGIVSFLTEIEKRSTLETWISLVMFSIVGYFLSTRSVNFLFRIFQ